MLNRGLGNASDRGPEECMQLTPEISTSSRSTYGDVALTKSQGLSSIIRPSLSSACRP